MPPSARQDETIQEGSQGCVSSRHLLVSHLKDQRYFRIFRATPDARAKVETGGKRSSVMNVCGPGLGSHHLAAARPDSIGGKISFNDGGGGTHPHKLVSHTEVD